MVRVAPAKRGGAIFLCKNLEIKKKVRFFAKKIKK